MDPHGDTSTKGRTQAKTQSIHPGIHVYTIQHTSSNVHRTTHLQNKHGYQISTSESSQIQPISDPDIKQYLIQYRSLSLGLTRARTHTRTPLNRNSVGFQRPGGCGASRARAHRSPRRTERARSPPFLRAGHQRRPTAAWAFAARPRSCREVPSQSPASFQTPKRKKAKSQPFASIQHTFGEWLLASDLQNRFPRGVPGRAETARVTEAGVEHS